jgi:hypothetical protein
VTYHAAQFNSCVDVKNSDDGVLRGNEYVLGVAAEFHRVNRRSDKESADFYARREFPYFGRSIQGS